MARTSVPKSSIAKILVELHAHGMLAYGVLGDTTENEVRKHIGKAVAANAAEVTPYGPAMQTIVLDAQPPHAAFRWDFIHPLALLLLLAKLSCNFAAVLLQCVAFALMLTRSSSTLTKCGQATCCDQTRAELPIISFGRSHRGPSGSSAGRMRG